MEGTEEKRQKLTEMMDKLAGEDIMVAFSGGVDSSLLLKAACDSAGRTGKKVYAVTIQTALHPTEDIEVACGKGNGGRPCDSVRRRAGGGRN